MKLYSENKDYKLYQGNMLDMLEAIEPNSIDSIITDPPYGLTSITKRFGKENSAECKYGKDGSFARLSRGFMGKEWDGSGIEYNIETWKKCYEVLKPGGYLLAFGGSRTFHRIACAIEDAGFEIRDTIMWLYGSGFPKSLNIGLALDKKNGIDNRTGNIVKGVGSNNTNSMKNGLGESQEFASEYEERIAQNEWQGWGTALKPSFEPIIVARKPFKGSLVDNVIEYSVGGINIDECRIETTDIRKGGSGVIGITGFSKGKQDIYTDGRFPANTILTYDETDFDEVCGGFPNTKSQKAIFSNDRLKKFKEQDGCERNLKGGTFEYGFNDSGSASRYFYCAKASKKDRDEGLDDFEEKPKTLTENKGRTFNDRCAICGKKFIGSPETICHCENPITDKSKSAMSKNTHPTVKPTELMQYLVRLVTPNGGTILDPFNGSGSTGKAVMYENREKDKNYKYIGIELTEEYLPIAKARIEYVCKLNEEELKEMQLSIFDI